MGSPPGEPVRKPDEDLTEVEIPHGFFLATAPVRQREWSAVMPDNPSFHAGDDLPVNAIDWHEAAAFCRHLSEREGRAYRLPTDREWEYACRAGSTTAFTFGPRIDTTQVNYDGQHTYRASPKGPHVARPTPPGRYPANAFGLLDTHGNVWEWCADILPDTGTATLRVLRGGCYDAVPGYCRSAMRNVQPPHRDAAYYGFRVVLEGLNPSAW